MTCSAPVSPRRGGPLTLPPLVKGVVRGELELTIGSLVWEPPAAKAVSCQARAAAQAGACLLAETAARSTAAEAKRSLLRDPATSPCTFSQPERSARHVADVAHCTLITTRCPKQACVCAQARRATPHERASSRSAQHLCDLPAPLRRCACCGGATSLAEPCYRCAPRPMQR